MEKIIELLHGGTTLQNALGVISALIAIVSLLSYLISCIKAKTKPHVFSWVLWTLLTWIAFAIQFSEGGGPGSWPTGISALFCIAITIVAFKKGHKDITKSDWISFIAGLCAIPLWLITNDPTLSAIIVTLIDAIGFFPTIRKSWNNPKEEMVFTHLMSLVKHCLSVGALITISVSTAFYPIILVVMNFILTGAILFRRHKLYGSFKG